MKALTRLCCSTALGPAVQGSPWPHTSVCPQPVDGKLHANVTFDYREESPALKLEHKSGTSIPPDTQGALLSTHPPAGTRGHREFCSESTQEPRQPQSLHTQQLAADKPSD